MMPSQNNNKDHLRKWDWWAFAILCSFTLVALIFGSVGYSNLGLNRSGSIYNAFRLLFLETDWDSGKNITGSLNFARWFGLLTHLFVLGWAFSYVARRQIRRWWVLHKKHYVICGMENGAFELAENMLRNNEKIVIVVDQAHVPDLVELEELCAVVIYGNINDIDTLRKTMLERCESLLVMTGNDITNMSIVGNANTILMESTEKMECHVLLNDKRLVRFMPDNTPDNATKLSMHYFNPQENIARTLFDKKFLYLSHDTIVDLSAAIHLLIIGFTSVGEHILIQALLNGHFVNGKKIYITILDPEAVEKEKKIMLKYEKIAKTCQELRFICCDSLSQNTGDEIFSDKSTPPVSHVVICSDNDTWNLTTSLFLADHLVDVLQESDIKKIPIAILLTQLDTGLGIDSDPSPKYPLAHLITKMPGAFLFGSRREISTQEIILQESLDKMARAIHGAYKRQHKAPEWDKLDNFLKDSNRASAAHIMTKLHGAGLEVDMDNASKNTDEEIREFNEMLGSKELVLARSEHERFMAFHYINGWDVLSLEECRSTGKHQDKKSRRHGCLVPWEELPYVAEAIKEENKEHFWNKDKEIIRNLPDIVMMAGYRIKKCENNECQKQT
jgi:hypothetical protein